MMIRNTFIILLLHITLFSCSNSSTEQDSLYSFILPIALNEFFSDDLDGKHFVLDTTGVGSLIEYSFEDQLFGDDLINSMKKYATEHEFSDGLDWIKDFQNGPFTIEYQIRNNTTGIISITEPIITSTNQILIYTELFCGNDCGGGFIYRLQAEKNVWVIANKELVWSGKKEDLDEVKKKFNIK